MSIKEQIRKIAADPQKGRLLSAQMLMAAREGFNPTMILEDGRKVRLVRIGARTSPGQR